MQWLAMQDFKEFLIFKDQFLLLHNYIPVFGLETMVTVQWKIYLTLFSLKGFWHIDPASGAWFVLFKEVSGLQKNLPLLLPFRERFKGHPTNTNKFLLISKETDVFCFSFSWEIGVLRILLGAPSPTAICIERKHSLQALLYKELTS